ncbi:efflux RND transporter periplasmic adaptor subunit [Paucibacter sp. DJ2R-2]|uniref:efflux RND transporter periplasmic adaptor subunit n=1 Tax=Paucibacter sp. DJ2R-2 TaxID=2893558 RepID=UPI0021E3FDA9|nr:efflux RND transporter periplasmic adaptor subunit [Paucibacter sp. DJ2R-2]MCV2438666.1 efflux RND transporter periplasmic adaptor subunit [Paucibacter sp. DJ2R-2]
MSKRIAIGMAFVAIAATGYALVRQLAPHGISLKPVAQAVNEVVPQGWTCPMHPDVLRDAPGTCPICNMALIRAEVSNSNTEVVVQVSAAQQRSIGLVTEAVGASPLASHALGSGQVVQDEGASVLLAPKAEGWVRSLAVGGVGQPVRKGQLLYELYSPELQQRQREYLDLLTRRDGLLNRSGGMGAIGNAAPEIMLASIAKERFRARTRLLAADIPEDVLQELETSRRVRELVPIRAERDGVVTSLSMREGSAVSPSQPVLGYADTRRIAVELSFSPEQLGTLGARARVRVRVQSSVDPRQVVALTIQPQQALVDPVSRLAKLRAALEPGSQTAAFPPGSLVRVQLASATPALLTVPRDAVMRIAGADQVIVADEHTRFRPVQVSLGREDADRVEVLSGLQAGQRVVVNGQFLIGTEASWTAARARLATRTALSTAVPAVTAEHHHEH